MQTRLCLAGVLGALALAGCSRNPPADYRPIGFLGAQWHVTLTPPLASSSSHVGGTATVIGNADSTRTRIELTVYGAPPQTRLTWRLQRGPCGVDGPVLGPPDAYAPLEVGQDGAATGTATLALPMPRRGQYHLRVAADGDSSVLACGTLTGPSS